MINLTAFTKIIYMSSIRIILQAVCLVLFTLPAQAQQKTFHNYPCTKDCSGHKAGYSWAMKHAIANPEDCHGRSKSFVEGCRAWAEEQAKMQTPPQAGTVSPAPPSSVP